MRERKKSISYMLETSLKCLERGKQISRNRESVATERDCGANVWHITVGEQHTESGNEKQEEVEPPPSPSLHSQVRNLI